MTSSRPRPFDNNKQIHNEFLRNWLNLHAAALDPVAGNRERFDENLVKYLKVVGYNAEFVNHVGDNTTTEKTT